MTPKRTSRLLASLLVSTALVGCQTTVPPEIQARADQNWEDCLETMKATTTDCLAQYNAEIAAAGGTQSDATTDDGPSDLWWQIPLLVVLIPVGIVALAYAGSSSDGDGGRYKGYKTYDSWYGSTHCRTQMSGSRSYTNCN